MKEVPFSPPELYTDFNILMWLWNSKQGYFIRKVWKQWTKELCWILCKKYFNAIQTFYPQVLQEDCNLLNLATMCQITLRQSSKESLHGFVNEKLEGCMRYYHQRAFVCRSVPQCSFPFTVEPGIPCRAWLSYVAQCKVVPSFSLLRQ